MAVGLTLPRAVSRERQDKNQKIGVSQRERCGIVSSINSSAFAGKYYQNVKHETRSAALDAARASMMLVGVFLHILLFSKRAIENRSVFEDYVISGVYFTFHTFRLPAFFVLAGFFACLLIEKRGLSGFLRNRATRLGLVLVLVAPLIVVATLHVSGRTQAVADFEGVVRAGFLHLWFIYYLLIISALLYLFSLIRTSPRFVEFQARAGVWISDPRVLLFASLLLMVAPQFLDRRAMIRISTSLIPDLPLFGFYAIFFISGILLFRSGKAGLEALRKRAYVLCFVGMALRSSRSVGARI